MNHSVILFQFFSPLATVQVHSGADVIPLRDWNPLADLNHAAEMEKKVIEMGKGRAYADAPAFDHDHRHAQEISTFSLVARQPLDWLAFHRWLGDLRASHGDRLLRVKGLLNVADEEGPVVIHGVQHIFHPPVALGRWPDHDRTSRLVMIVRGLDRFAVEAGWLCLSA